MLGIFKKFFNRPLTQGQFAPIALEALRREWPAETFTLDLARFQVQHAGSGTIFLGNIFHDYVGADAPTRAEYLSRFVRSVVPSGTPDIDFEAAKDQLLPVLRELSGVDLIRIQQGADKPLSAVMSFLPLSDELGIAVAVDSEFAITQIGGDVLERWNMSLEELLKVAVDNLRHKAAPAFTEIGPGLFASQYGDFYDAPRMLIHEHVWQLPVGGNPVAMVPNRSCLLVCGSENTGAMAKMLDIARPMLLEESRPLSGEMFRLHADRWTSWCPPGDQGVALRRLQREIITGSYASQKEALDALHATAGRDVFVATHTLVQRDGDGHLISYAVLTNGVHTLLPKADIVCLLFGADLEPLTVSMADFLECAAAFVKRLDYVLPRYEVDQFPDAACIERLRDRQTSFATAAA